MRTGLCAFSVASLWCSALGGTTPEGLKWLEENKQKPGVKVTDSGLQYKVITSGPEGGKSPKKDSPCEVHYKGKNLDDSEFDSSYSRGKPTTFAPNQVIAGWTEAMQLMKEGDKWELTIPSELAYGDRGAGGKIKAGAVLIFEMEILKVNEPSAFNIGGIDLSDPKVMLGGGALVVMLIYQFFFSGGGDTSKGPLVSLESASDAGNPKVFLSMTIGDESAGDIEIELFASVCPKTAENFRCLCTGEKGKGPSGKPLHFKDSAFHRVIPGFMCQGGDFTRGNGTGGESIYGNKFEDEWTNGYIAHSEPMLLSMANAGPNTNGSQFFLTTARTPHLDCKHVVFGRVTSGVDVVKRIEGVGSSGGSTKKRVAIADCGEVKTKDT